MAIKKDYHEWVKIWKRIEDLLDKGKLTKAQIAREVGCRPSVVGRIAKKRLSGNSNEECFELEHNQESVVVNDIRHVTGRWLADAIDHDTKTIDFGLRYKKVPRLLFHRRLDRRIRVYAYPLEMVWQLLPKWKARYDHLHKETGTQYEKKDHAQFRNITQKQYDLLCAFIEWWIEFQYWPSAKDLLTRPLMLFHFKNESQILFHLSQLEKLGYVTTIPDPLRSQNNWGRRDRFVIHKAPKHLIGQLSYCPHCSKPHRIPWPFFQPQP